jgi:hypothetical protein
MTDNINPMLGATVSINEDNTTSLDLPPQIQAAIEAGLQSGEITMEDLNMAIQLAKTVVQNPNLYPQIRQFAIQKGLATEEELPLDYDEGLVITLLTAAKSLSFNMQPSNQPMQEMQEGGVLKGPSHAEGGIPVKVAGDQIAEMEGGEYVIPKNVVRAKGTEFFDKMLANYEDKE